MQTHVIRVSATANQPVRWLLSSDQHLGATHARPRRFVAELEAAARVGARVLINGDLFDGVTSGDKRYDPNTLIPRLRGAKDVATALADYAAEILAPFARYIEIIGIGNHEEAVIKYRQFDPVALTIARLNADLKAKGVDHQIRHGGIMGFVVTMVDIERDNTKPASLAHRLLYMHGSGGDSPVTKGTIDANRKGVAFEYDCLTFGHKHNQLSLREAVIGVTPRGRLVRRDRITVQTGSYYENYVQTDQAGALNYSYAESKHHAPKPIGGSMLVLTPRRNSQGYYRLQQDYHPASMPL